MSIKIDGIEEDEARALLLRCCGSAKWVDKMMELRPFGTEDGLTEAAGREWYFLDKEDWPEAFAKHPPVGSDLEELTKSEPEVAELVQSEQEVLAAAPEELRQGLVEGNAKYDEKFDWIYVVRVVAKEADEILDDLNTRLDNDPDSELQIAAEQQAEITHLRLLKLAV